MTEATVRPGSTGHSHGGGDIPLQTRNERLRSIDPSMHTKIDGRDEQWRYLDSARMGGLDTNTLRDASSELKVSAPAEFSSDLVDASDPSFGIAGLPEDLPTANAWAAATKALKLTLSGEAKASAISGLHI